MLIVLIHNDGTGDDAVGNYDYEIRINSRTLAKGRILNHLRHNEWWELVKKVAEEGEVRGRWSTPLRRVHRGVLPDHNFAAEGKK